MKKRVLCAFFAAAIAAIGAMAGCSGGNAPQSAAESKAASSADAGADKKEEDKAEQKPAEESSEAEATATLEGLKAAKIGRVNVTSDKVGFTEGGIIYQGPDGKYGVVSLDGAKDTGSVYASAREATYQTVIVTEKEFGGDALNTSGLIGSDGSLLVPAKYANIEVLNERYARVFTADKETSKEDNAVVFEKDGFFYSTAVSGCKMYSGKWEVYDLQKKELVKNVSGTSAKHYVVAKGQFILYYDAKERQVTCDAKGVEVTDGKQIFDNGSYIFEMNGKSTVYSADEKELFRFDTKDYTISSFMDYYYVGKKDKNYFLIDETGEIVSAEFPEYFSKVFPGAVKVDNYLYALDGTKLISEKVTSVCFDTVNKDAYAVDGESRSYLLDAKGKTVMSQPADSDTYKDSTLEFLFWQKATSGYRFYNVSDKAYSIESVAGASGNWVVATEAGALLNLTDTRSGAEIIDSYAGYRSVISNGVEYVFAFNSVNGQVSRGSFDIYKVGV